MKGLSIAFLLLCFACGGGGKPAKSMEEMKKEHEEMLAANRNKKPGATEPVAAPVEEVKARPNPKFSMLRTAFSDFLRKPLDGKVNIFRNNLGAFAPHVEIEADTEPSMEEPKTPLEYYDVDSYGLVLIMGGTAESKALVIDPKGKAFTVQVGTRIGNRAGKIVSITTGEMRIEEPGHPPVIKSLEPHWEEMERELQAVQEF